jgi:hypothetical protein
MDSSPTVILRNVHMLPSIPDSIALIFLAQVPPAGTQTTSSTPWWQVVTGIIAIPAALLGLYYTYLLSQKTRWETKELRRKIREDEGTPSPQAPLRILSGLDSPRLVAANIQDFLIRWIILTLVYQVWGIISGFFSPLISATTQYLYTQQQMEKAQRQIESGQYNPDSPSWLATYGQVAPTVLVDWLGSTLIFIVLGLPLLTDVIRAVGGNVFSFRKSTRLRDNVPSSSEEPS